MYSSNKDDSSDMDNQGVTKTDDDSSVRTYAIIETSPDELEHIVDLLGQFFPKTKIIEYHNPNLSLHLTTTQQQQTTNESHLPLSSNIQSQTFKGKVKGYLQRRYLEQIDEYQPPKDIFNKRYSDNLSTSLTINKTSVTSKSRSLDLSANSPPENPSLGHSQSKRNFLQRSSTIDTDDTSNDTTHITFNIDQPDTNDGGDDDELEEGEVDQFQLPYSKQQQTKNKRNLFLPPYHPSEQEQEKKRSSVSSTIPPLTPYSATSDPGPFHSPWFNTPTSPYNFRFPQSQEPLAVNAQGSIVQLSTLTKMFCDEPSLYTPISPRLKTDKHNPNTSKDSSSVPACQICRQEFDSPQTYLTHYRTHLENPCENDKSDMLDSDAPCDRFGDLRNYSCNICSKRFSRSDMLNRHLRLHSGIRPYRCTMCNTHFSRSDHLSTHLRTHTGEKPYTCPHCPYTACRRDMITRHLKIHAKQQRSERKNATSTYATSNDSEKIHNND